MKVRVRFAPSPTGPLHPGGIRTALYNYLFAKKHGGDFILRIEDTDQARFVEGAEQFIMNSLSWCGIEYSEGPGIGGPYGPYRQSERKEIYLKYANYLVEHGYAYYAFDTTDELEALHNKLESEKADVQNYGLTTRMNMRNSLTLSTEEVAHALEKNVPYVIRYKNLPNRTITINDIVRGEVNFSSNILDDKVLFKSDGMPTYHLANIVDDHLMDISHVIRGEEWLSSAPLHVLLYESFGWIAPQFAHLPLLLKPEGTGKLSKRDGDKFGFPFFALNWTDPLTQQLSVGLKDSGYLATAYINFISLLGWNPGTEQELYNTDELIDLFSLEKINKSGARYDFDKLKWFNQQYLKRLKAKEIALIIKPQLDAQNVDYNSSYIEEVCDLIKERLFTIQDFWPMAQYFFESPKTFDQNIVAKRWKSPTPAILLAVATDLKALKVFNAEKIHESIELTCNRNEVKMGSMMQPLRLVLTGQSGGPDLMQTCVLLGQEECTDRINFAVALLGMG